MKISDHFTWKKIILFTLPPISMMVFTSLYGVVDGFFISNFVGETEFAAINFVLPIIMILGSIGFMFGSGGSALIAKTIGEGNKEKANKIFSLLIYTVLIIGIIFSLIMFFALKPLLIVLGADANMIEPALVYGKILLITLPLFVLQFTFQNLIITSEKPTFGLIVTLIVGFTNIILDALFIAIFKWGIYGAAAATAISQSLGGIIPLIYYLRKNTSLLKLGKTTFDIKSILKTCLNGLSEFISNVAMSILGIIFNAQLMKYYGEYGVSAYGVYMYVGFIFVAIFIGYVSGVAPIIGYNFGAKNTKELKNVFYKSLLFISITSICMALCGVLLSKPLAYVFVSYNDDLFKLTEYVLKISSLSFLFSGINILASSFFTALNNGLVSAIISFGRTIIFQTGLVIVLPFIFNENGIWYSIVLSEIFSIIVSITFLICNKRKYSY